MTDSDTAYTWLRGELRKSVAGYGIFTNADCRWSDADMLNAVRDAVKDAQRVKLMELAVRWLEKDGAEMKRDLAESRRSVNV